MTTVNSIQRDNNRRQFSVFVELFCTKGDLQRSGINITGHQLNHLAMITSYHCKFTPEKSCDSKDLNINERAKFKVFFVVPWCVFFLAAPRYFLTLFCRDACRNIPKQSKDTYKQPQFAPKKNYRVPKGNSLVQNKTIPPFERRQTVKLRWCT